MCKTFDVISDNHTKVEVAQSRDTSQFDPNCTLSNFRLA